MRSSFTNTASCSLFFPPFYICFNVLCNFNYIFTSFIYQPFILARPLNYFLDFFTIKICSLDSCSPHQQCFSLPKLFPISHIYNFVFIIPLAVFTPTSSKYFYLPYLNCCYPHSYLRPHDSTKVINVKGNYCELEYLCHLDKFPLHYHVPESVHAHNYLLWAYLMYVVFLTFTRIRAAKEDRE